MMWPITETRALEPLLSAMGLEIPAASIDGTSDGGDGKCLSDTMVGGTDQPAKSPSALSGRHRRRRRRAPPTTWCSGTCSCAAPLFPVGPCVRFFGGLSHGSTHLVHTGVCWPGGSRRDWVVRVGRRAHHHEPSRRIGRGAAGVDDGSGQRGQSSRRQGSYRRRNNACR